MFEESFTGSPSISENNIHDNYFSHISLYSEQQVSVINNWWGTTDLNMIQAKILDFYGNPTSRLVTFEPILTQPVETEVIENYSLNRSFFALNPHAYSSGVGISAPFS